MEARLAEVLAGVKARRGRVLALTGAGISAESGIPTFRGAEGFWVVGSKNYMPQEMATREMFERNPREVWRWYLYRFGVCRGAEPNAGHRALVELDRALGDRFHLVTQNIDGLHLRAGSTVQRTYCIHGDAGFTRCADECTLDLHALPEMGPRGGETPFGDQDRRRLSCPRCGGWLRPHVLWFDEYYDEHWYKMQSSLRAAEAADLLLVVGTSGATNLPSQIGDIAWRRDIVFVDVNPEENPFAARARSMANGVAVRGRAAERLPEIVRALV